MDGTVSILSVGSGDTKISFDPSNAAERIRAARIVADMLRRGYALLVEVERRGKKSFQRVKEFREDLCEYIIADLDPVSALTADVEEGYAKEAAAAHAPKAGRAPRGKLRTRPIPAEKARAVAVPRSAGG